MNAGVEWVEHDRLRFKCKVDGAGGDAPWIVFSNSLLTDLGIWDAQVAALADRYRILRYDQRGHGGTSVPSTPCSFDQLGADMIALMDHFNIERATLVGLSMGVTTGLQVYGKHPERIERLVLADGQAATAEGGYATWESRIAEAQRLGMAGLAEITMTRWFSESFRAGNGAARALAAASATPLEGFIACARALQAYDFNAVLPQINVPTLMMAGANDGQMPNTMRQMCSRIDGAVMHIIPDAGHIPNFEQADRFNSHLMEFLQLSPK